MTKIGRDLITSANEAVAMAEGAAIGRKIDIPVPDVAAIRKRQGLSQASFAARYGLSAATIRDWEQGRRVPDLPARTLLRVIERDPEAVARAVEAA